MTCVHTIFIKYLRRCQVDILTIQTKLNVVEFVAITCVEIKFTFAESKLGFLICVLKISDEMHSGQIYTQPPLITPTRNYSL